MERKERRCRRCGRALFGPACKIFCSERCRRKYQDERRMADRRRKADQRGIWAPPWEEDPWAGSLGGSQVCENALWDPPPAR